MAALNSGVFSLVPRPIRCYTSVFSFAILRATTLCLRGSRTKWRSGAAIDDRAGLPEIAY